MSSRTQRGSLVAQLLISLALLCGALVVFLNRQLLFDHVMAWQFRPSPAIAALSERTAFSDSGEFLFYASQPQLLGRNAFNDACRSTATEHTAVLGCYAGNRIFLFDINNEMLDGIKEVTAAHEMLHAAYQRLGPAQKKRVDTLLARQSFGADAERINGLLAEYAKSEPGERLNELHSILGSEVRSLDPELEAYYAQYFTDRSIIVGLSERYQAVFAELQSRQESLVTELTDLADEIDERGAVYRRNLQVLDNDVEAFNREAARGDMTRDSYDRQRAALESRQASLRREYSNLQALIVQYDRKRSELASINTESQALSRSINSSVAPVPDAIDG